MSAMKDSSRSLPKKVILILKKETFTCLPGKDWNCYGAYRSGNRRYQEYCKKKESDGTALPLSGKSAGRRSIGRDCERNTIF